MRLRREKREEERRHPEEQAGGLEELMRLLPQLRGLVGNQHRIVSQSYEKLHYRAVIISGTILLLIFHIKCSIRIKGEQKTNICAILLGK